MTRDNVFTDAVLGAVTDAVVQAVKDPQSPLEAPPGRAFDAARAVKTRVVRSIASDPAVRHVTNTEPWYRSRVTIGALISMLAMALSAAGISIASEERELLITLGLGLGGLVGPLTTLYGRWMARRPIGA